MENYLQISFINDFIFCPRSIYFHQLYGKSDTSFTIQQYNKDGKNAHKTIDNKTYTTSKIFYKQ